MRRLLLPLLLLLLPTLASAQVSGVQGEGIRRDREGGQWISLPGEGCVGGSTCRQKSMRVPLQDRPVIGVRFYAHDEVGTKADGKLRVRIDATTVQDYLDIPRRGETFTIDVDELRGRHLVLEAINDDEVMIENIEVLYGKERERQRPRDDDERRGPRGDGGWKSYPRAKGCIGGTECSKNGTRITIALDSASVLGVRFHAHDAIGTRADGKVEVRIDGTLVAGYVDVQRNGKMHEFDVDRVRGLRLVIATTSNDEVEISDVEVLYARDAGRRGPGERETRHEGGCIGGEECGGRRARIRIPLRDLPVDTIRFYARDDVGARAGGRLRIQIDDHVLESSIDIKREGSTLEVNGEAVTGEYLFIFPADDDEVVIKDIRIKYGD